MGSFHQEFWLSEGQGQTRTERKSGAYQYYLPTKLSDLKFSLETDVVSDIVRAERALLESTSSQNTLAEIDGLSRFLLRAEAISSSFIEGLQLGSKRLMQAELNEVEPCTFKPDKTANEIIGNIKALRSALDMASKTADLELVDILSIHRSLLKATTSERFGGKLREVQNWIGGNSYNPLNAQHIPPAPAYVDELLEDLIAYANRTDISPVLQAALVHAQFETIHPFIDGNGRSGRALIHLVLKRRGLLGAFVPPISLLLATYSQSYLEGLNSLRFSGKQPDEQAMEAVNEWISFFSGCCLRACNEINGFRETAQKKEAVWRKELEPIRKNSALDRMLGCLMGMPIFSVNSMAAGLGQSYQSVNIAIERLVMAGIAKPMSAAKRNRVYEVPDALDAFRLFERQLASPLGDTKVSAPARPVPY